MAIESPYILTKLSSACSADAQNGHMSSVKNSISTVRFVGAGNSGASEQNIARMANMGRKIMIFFIRNYIGKCFAVNVFCCFCQKNGAGLCLPHYAISKISIDQDDLRSTRGVLCIETGKVYAVWQSSAQVIATVPHDG